MLFPPPPSIRTNPVNLRRKTAFTLIELLLVILILSVMLGIGYSSLIRARTNADFKQAINETIGILQNARNKAMTNPEIVTDDGNVYVANAFYVTLDTSTNTLSLKAEIGDETVEDQLLESVVLNEGVTLTVAPEDLERISYEPPMGELTFVFTSSDGDEVIITLSMGDGAFTQNITLNQFRGMPEIVE